MEVKKKLKEVKNYPVPVDFQKQLFKVQFPKIYNFGKKQINLFSSFYLPFPQTKKRGEREGRQNQSNSSLFKSKDTLKSNSAEWSRFEADEDDHCIGVSFRFVPTFSPLCWNLKLTAISLFMLRLYLFLPRTALQYYKCISCKF